MNKKELESFIIENIPILVRPVRKSKYEFVSVFTSNNALQATIGVLTDKLWERLNETIK
jgi:hypothetical protein